MAYITREEWGARPPARGRNSINARPLGTAIHWNGPPCAASIRKHSQCAGFVRGIQNYHMDVKRWSDIAYTDFTCPHGDVFEGRGRDVGTAANGTDYGNANYYAVYLMWGEGDGTPPDAMLDAAADAVAMHRTWGAGDEVTTHRALYRTECPGDEIAGMVGAGRFDGGRGGGAQDVDFDVPQPKPRPKPSKGDPDLLEKGDEGKAVRALQVGLNRAFPAYSDLVVDGIFGPATEKVVREFQKRSNLVVDGLVGSKTKRELAKYGIDLGDAPKAKPHPKPKPAPKKSEGLLRRGSEGRKVRALQKSLNDVFPAYSDLSVDGDFGPATERVVREFQRRSGLVADGIVGAKTRKALARYGIKA